MLITDVATLVGLILRQSWGYYLAIILFLQQSLMQPYFAYKRYLTGFFMVHPVEWFVVPGLVIGCFFLLIINRNQFVNEPQ